MATSQPAEPPLLRGLIWPPLIRPSQWRVGTRQPFAQFWMSALKPSSPIVVSLNLSPSFSVFAFIRWIFS